MSAMSAPKDIAEMTDEELVYELELLATLIGSLRVTNGTWTADTARLRAVKERLLAKLEEA